MPQSMFVLIDEAYGNEKCVDYMLEGGWAARVWVSVCMCIGATNSMVIIITSINWVIKIEFVYLHIWHGLLCLIRYRGYDAMGLWFLWMADPLISTRIFNCSCGRGQTQVSNRINKLKQHRSFFVGRSTDLVSKIKSFILILELWRPRQPHLHNGGW